MEVVSILEEVKIHDNFPSKFEQHSKRYNNIQVLEDVICRLEDVIYKMKKDLLNTVEKEIKDELKNKFGVNVEELEFYILEICKEDRKVEVDFDDTDFYVFEVCGETVKYQKRLPICYIKLNEYNILILIEPDLNFEDEILNYFEKEKKIKAYLLSDYNIEEFAEKIGNIKEIVNFIGDKFIGGRYVFLCS